MKFALITKTGRIFTFYIENTAKIYQKAYGGVVFLLLNTENDLTEGEKTARITL